MNEYARVAELVDALDLGSSGVTRESSSLSFRTNTAFAEDCFDTKVRFCFIHWGF